MRRIYLDNSATSWPKPEAVYQTADHYMRQVGASAGRGAYVHAQQTGAMIDNARRQLCRLIGADDPTRIIFTLNCSGALNIGLQGVVQPGDHVVTTAMAHNSVLRPLNALKEAGICDYTRVPCSPEGMPDLNRIADAVRPNTRLIAVIHGSNVTGSIYPIDQIGAIAQEKGVLLLVDAAQTAGACPIDVQAWHIDMLAVAGHKGTLGPSGTGCLYIRPGLDVRPLYYGGTGSKSELDVQPEFLPDRHESGSHNAAGIAGLGAGVKFLLDEGIDKVRAHKIGLTRKLRAGLQEIDGVTVYGPPPEQNAAVISITVNGWDPVAFAEQLDEHYGVQTRAGLHCAPWAHRTIGTFPTGTVRLSLGYFTTAEEIELAITAVAELAAVRPANVKDGKVLVPAATP